jgi:hypothetical protein
MLIAEHLAFLEAFSSLQLSPVFIEALRSAVEERGLALPTLFPAV